MRSDRDRHIRRRPLLDQRVLPPLVGGCVLTVDWVAEPVNANLMTHLPTNPTWTAVTLLTLNTMALSSWWRCFAPNTPKRARP